MAPQDIEASRARDETWGFVSSTPLSNGSNIRLLPSRADRCIVVCRLHWQVEGKASSVQADEHIIYLPIPKSAASHPHEGDEGAMRQPTGAEPAGIVGITLRVAQVVHGGAPVVHGSTGEGVESPTSRSAWVGRTPEVTATAAASPAQTNLQLAPAPRPSASYTDPAMLHACVRHLRASLLQDSRAGGGSLLLDALDVAMALRLGIRDPSTALLAGPILPPSAAPPFHLPVEGQRTANGRHCLTRS